MSLSTIDTESLTAITQALSEAMDKKLVSINSDLGHTLDSKLDKIKIDLNTDLGNTIDTKWGSREVSMF